MVGVSQESLPIAVQGFPGPGLFSQGIALLYQVVGGHDDIYGAYNYQVKELNTPNALCVLCGANPPRTGWNPDRTSL